MKESKTMVELNNIIMIDLFEELGEALRPEEDFGDKADRLYEERRDREMEDEQELEDPIDLNDHDLGR